MRCGVPEACPGVAPTSVATSGSNLFIDTQQCSVGYTGQMCSSCASGYFQQAGLCYYCGSSVDQSATIALTVLVGAGVITLLAVGVALLPSMQLAQAMQVS